MMARIKFLAYGRDRLHLQPTQNLFHLLHDQFDACTQLIKRAGRLQSQLEVIQHRQQGENHLPIRELASFSLLFFGAPASILELRHVPQVLVFGFLESSFQLADLNGGGISYCNGAFGFGRRIIGMIARRDIVVRGLARHPLVTDVDRLVQAYLRASRDSFNDARLSAVAALAAIAGAGPEGRAAVATGFVARVPRADDYLVRRFAVEKLPDAAAAWGGMAPIVTGRTMDEYRVIVRRLLLPARRGRAGPRVTIETDGGRLVVELLPVEAPLTVAAFLALADRRYFDGSTWHRVVPNFVVQDGDPRGDGWGGPAFVLRDEINPVRYESGTVGMALSGPDTGGSQWFVTHSPQPHLNSLYTIFGQIAEGQSVVERIGQGERIVRVTVVEARS